eukprot:4213407-Amphidinium_carterae.2
MSKREESQVECMAFQHVKLDDFKSCMLASLRSLLPKERRHTDTRTHTLVDGGGPVLIHRSGVPNMRRLGDGYGAPLRGCGSIVVGRNERLLCYHVRKDAETQLGLAKEVRKGAGPLLQCVGALGCSYRVL